MMPDSEQVPYHRLARVRRRVIQWYKKNGRSFPWRNSRDAYEILIAEMLLRRTTASAVLRVYSPFIEEFPSPVLLASASIAAIASHVGTLGLQEVRAKHLHAMASQLVSSHSRTVPHNYSDLRALPGVGRYTANAVLNFAFRIARPLVDGNILHFLSRVFGLTYSGASDETAWNFMKRLGGRQQNPKLYWGIIDLAAKICLRRNPRCAICPMNRECWWKNNDRQREES